jgi:hypothetical protein
MKHYQIYLKVSDYLKLDKAESALNDADNNLKEADKIVIFSLK